MILGRGPSSANSTKVPPISERQSYDFTLKFAPQLPPDISRDSLPPEMQNLPSIFDAVIQQLGLKLEAQRGPVEYYVIENVDKPSAN